MASLLPVFYTCAHQIAAEDAAQRACIRARIPRDKVSTGSTAKRNHASLPTLTAFVSDFFVIFVVAEVAEMGTLLTCKSQAEPPNEWEYGDWPLIQIRRSCRMLEGLDAFGCPHVQVGEREVRIGGGGKKCGIRDYAKITNFLSHTSGPSHV